MESMVRQTSNISKRFLDFYNKVTVYQSIVNLAQNRDAWEKETRARATPADHDDDDCISKFPA